MGIDITAYRNVKLVPDAALDEDGYPADDNEMRVRRNPDFPGRADDIVDLGIYTIGDEQHGFYAGPYSTYGIWREQLAKLVGYPIVAHDHRGPRHAAGAWAATDGPFWELINFSDCDGVIGSAVSEKLATDFAAFQKAADESGDLRFIELYAQFRQAFELAAVGGLVHFH